MAFTELEIADHTAVLEEHFWAFRRPPLHLRDRICDGQRLTDQSIELFFVRPIYDFPGKFIENSIAKIVHVRSRDVWQLFWKRADGKWHRYALQPEAPSLAAALAIIHLDSKGCFFG